MFFDLRTGSSPLQSVCLSVTAVLSLQLVMQYLYFGGTDALHIRNSDVMEVGLFIKLKSLLLRFFSGSFCL